MHGLLGGPALAVRVDPAIERHAPVLDCDSDLAGLNAAIPLELRQHVAPDLVVGRANGFGRGCHAGSPFTRSATKASGAAASARPACAERTSQAIVRRASNRRDREAFPPNAPRSRLHPRAL